MRVSIVPATLGNVFLKTAHLWVQGLPTPQGGHDIQGHLELRGGRWSQGGRVGQEAPQDPAGRWNLAPGASSGELPAARFVLGDEMGPWCLVLDS